MLKPSPFHDSKDRPQVRIARGDGPYANTRKALESIDLSPAKGKKVLLKPNVGRVAENGSGVVTNPEVVAAAIDAFKEAGAEVSIGESPILGVKVMEAFEACGVAAVAKERDVPLINMDERKYVEVPLPEGVAIQSLRVCPEVLEHDIVVSIPVLKTHMHTGVSLTIKNMKGCLWRRSKVDLHMLPPVEEYDGKSLDMAIADMSYAMRPHLSIMDGSIGMEGLGPSAGEPKPLGLVIVGVDPFACDAVALRLMGIEPQEAPHLWLASRRGYGVFDIDQIDVSPDDWLDASDPFVPPPKDFKIDNPDLNVKILDENSCSGCQSTLFLFLKRFQDQLADYFPEGEMINIAIGKGHEELPEGTLCIGNCTRMHKDVGIYVPGCPPVGSAIINTIKEWNTPEDSKD
jgi:uncharacterized protein (DUF362 family)